LILLQLACLQQFLSGRKSTPQKASRAKNLYKTNGLRDESLWTAPEFSGEPPGIPLLPELLVPNLSVMAKGRQICRNKAASANNYVCLNWRILPLGPFSH
jgi:hypothetical protein